MKNKLLRIVATGGLWPLAFFFSACPKNGIVVPPVNGAEQKNFEDKWDSKTERILKRYPGDLYYIQNYAKGKPIGKPWGSLPEIFLDRSKADFQSLAGSDFNGHAYQIGVGLSKAKSAVVYLGSVGIGSGDESTAHAAHTHTLSPIAAHVHHPRLNEKIEQSAALIEEVDKALNSP